MTSLKIWINQCGPVLKNRMRISVIGRQLQKKNPSGNI